MAEHGAHLTSVVADKPSIFELLSQENLHRLTKPALHYLIKTLNKKSSTRLQLPYNHFDKLYALFDVLIQHYYLKNYGGSLAENFYGLQRIPSDCRGEFHQLPLSLHLKSLIALCLLPSIKEWLDKKFEDLHGMEDVCPSQQRWLKKLKQIFIHVYPYLHAFWQGLIFSYYIAYTFNSSVHYSPILHMTGVRLVTLVNTEPASSESQRIFMETIPCPSILKKFVVILLRGITYGMTHGLSLGIFFIQYLDWWQNAHQKKAVMFTNIPPPIKLKNEFTNKCPICLNKRSNETALVTSGFVFCYKCIHKYVNENKKCPVTKYATNLEQLIRLYQM